MLESYYLGGGGGVYFRASRVEGFRGSIGLRCFNALRLASLIVALWACRTYRLNPKP